MTDSRTRNFMKVAEVAEEFDLDARTVRRAIEDGEIPAVRIRGALRVPTRWVLAQRDLGLAATA